MSLTHFPVPTNDSLMKQTVVYREEAEKRAVWVAWINMEAHYGEPPGQAAMAIFHRALPYNNPKALHLALLSVLERAEQVCLTSLF